MMMNPGIILAGQQPDFINTLAQSTAAAQMQNDVRQENALRQFMSENGQKVFAGDQNALGSLAQISPDAAFSAASNRQNLDFSAEKMRMLRENARRAAAAHAAQLSAEERKAAAEKMQGVLKGAAHFYQQGDQEGYNAWLTQNGLDPAQYQFTAFPAHLAGATGTIDALVDVREYAQGPERTVQMTGAQLAERLPGASLDPGGIYNVTPDGKITPVNRTGVTVNVGDQVGNRPIVDKPPKGYQRRWDDAKGTYVDEPIPGSAADTETNAAETKLDLAVADYDRKFSLVESKVDEAIQKVEEGGRLVSGYGSLLSGLPESGARDLQAVIDTIRANLGFEELQAMRDASPTGGALGQVTEREIAFLQAVMGNLDTGQSPEQLLSVLRDIKKRRAEFRKERMRVLRGPTAQSVPSGDTTVDIGGQTYTVRPVE